MKIHSISKLIALPFEIAVVVILYLLFFEDMESLYPYLVPLVIFIVIIYTFSPKINYAWHKKHPPRVDQKLQKLIHKASPFFRNLSNGDRQKYLDRLSIFIYHKSYYMMRKEKEELPHDIKALIASNAITVTFNQDSYFFDKYDFFYAYQHPFPSPKRPELHSVESNFEDGVMIFDADQLFKSMVVGSSIFNIGMYAFAEAFLIENPTLDISMADEPDVILLSEHKKLALERIFIEIGYRDVYAKAVIVTLYFRYPSEIQRLYPEFYDLCVKTFGKQRTNSPDILLF